MIANNTIDDCEAIVSHATLLCVLTTAPDAETCLDQMNRVLWLIVEHAQAIQSREATALPRPVLSVVRRPDPRDRA
ncbi:hypothetical protein [Bradyrhizobium sp. USDA 3256]